MKLLIALCAFIAVVAANYDRAYVRNFNNRGLGLDSFSGRPFFISQKHRDGHRGHHSTSSSSSSSEEFPNHHHHRRYHGVNPSYGFQQDNAAYAPTHDAPAPY